MMKLELLKSDETNKIEIGKTYLVPCVFYENDYYPVWNNCHQEIWYEKDNRKDNFHYHMDLRFLQQKYFENSTTSDVLIWCFGKQEIFYKEMICVRNTPFYLASAEFKTNKEYNTEKINDYPENGKCPHKGFNLDLQKENENGIIICPLHNMKFKKKKLCLI